MAKMNNIIITNGVASTRTVVLSNRGYFDIVYADKSTSYHVAVVDKDGSSWFAYVFTPDNKCSVLPVTLPAGEFTVKIEVVHV